MNIASFYKIYYIFVVIFHIKPLKEVYSIFSNAIFLSKESDLIENCKVESGGLT